MEMLAVKYPESYCVHSSASTSDSDEQGCCKNIDNAKNKKLKNELCRNYLNMGFCRYFDKCQFAHGIQELRQSQKSNMKYKTKQCQSYFYRGCCQYGQRSGTKLGKPQVEIDEKKLQLGDLRSKQYKPLTGYFKRMKIIVFNTAKYLCRPDNNKLMVYNQQK